MASGAIAISSTNQGKFSFNTSQPLRNTSKATGKAKITSSHPSWGKFKTRPCQTPINPARTVIVTQTSLMVCLASAIKIALPTRRPTLRS